MNLEEQTQTSENTPRPFSEIPGLWMQLGQMTESFFSRELLRVNGANTIYGIMIYAIASAIISGVQSLLSGTLESIQNSEIALETGLFSQSGIPILLLCCFGLFMIPLGFYIHNGITYVCCKIFGGKGSFSAQAYLNSLYIVPFGLLSGLASLLSLIPIIGAFIFFVLVFGIMIAQFIYTIRSLKVVHQFTTGRAVSAILLPLIVFLVIPVCLIAILALMGPQIGNVFSNILTEIGTPVP